MSLFSACLFIILIVFSRVNHVVSVSDHTCKRNICFNHGSRLFLRNNGAFLSQLFDRRLLFCLPTTFCIFRTLDGVLECLLVIHFCPRGRAVVKLSLRELKVSVRAMESATNACFTRGPSTDPACTGCLIT